MDYLLFFQSPLGSETFRTPLLFSVSRRFVYLVYGGAGRRAEQNYVTTGIQLYSRNIGSHKTLNNYTGVQKRWLGSRVISVLDSGAEGPGFKLQS